MRLRRALLPLLALLLGAMSPSARVAVLSGGAKVTALDFTNGLPASVAYSRSGSRSCWNAAGTLVTLSANVPCIAYDPTTHAPLGLQVEGAATNSLRNSAANGAGTATYASGVAMNPSLPTYWSSVNSTSGLSRDVSPASYAGMTGVRIRFYGTTLASPNAETVEFESRSQIAAVAAQAWDGSVYARRTAGTIPGGMTFASRVLTLTSGAVVVDNVSTGNVSTLSSALTLLSTSITAGTNTAWITSDFHVFSWPANTAVDFTVEIYAPQLEQQGLASSRIITTGAAASRSQDLATITGSAFNALVNTAQGTLIADSLLEGMPGGNATIAQIDDGSDNNRLYWLIGSSGSVTLNQRTGGTFIRNSATAGGVVTALTAFRSGARWDGTYLASCGNGGTVAKSAAGTLPPGLSTLGVGYPRAGGQVTNGYIQRLYILRSAANDNTFQADCKQGAAVMP